MIQIEHCILLSYIKNEDISRNKFFFPYQVEKPNFVLFCSECKDENSEWSLFELFWTTLSLEEVVFFKTISQVLSFKC